MSWPIYWLCFWFVFGIAGSSFLYRVIAIFTKLALREQDQSKRARYSLAAWGHSLAWLGWMSIWTSGAITQLLALRGQL